MSRTSGVYGVFFLCLSSSCGSAKQGEAPGAQPVGEPAVLCDGTTGLRLQVVVVADEAHAGHLTMLQRNGAVYLRVDGACRYWVYGVGLSDAGGPPRTTTALDPIISGELSATEAEELSTALQYDRWGSYDGRRAEIGIQGLTPTVFTDGAHAFSCGLTCDAAGMPADAAGLRDRALDWAVRLTDAGQPVNGPVRLAAFDTGTTAVQWAEWGYACLESLLPQPPQSYAPTGEPPSTAGTLVTDKASELRAQRTQFRAQRFQVPPPPGVPAWSVNVALPICDGGTVWTLLVSDTVEPYEQDGVIPSLGL